MIKIAITTGDSDGIGYEVSAKALSQIGPSRGFQFFIFRSKKIKKSYSDLLKRKWKIISYLSLSEALSSCAASDYKCLIEIISSDPAPFWVIDSAKSCLKNQLDGICTAPMSKTLIHQVGLKDHGHTEIFKRLSGAKQVNMGFIGSEFNVVLATDHIPLRKVPAAVTSELLKSTIKNALILRSFLPKKIGNKPLALLGVNPHAGESGLLGKEEIELNGALRQFLERNQVTMPLPPDVAFLKKNWKNYSVYIATYHDQGLIPFKLVHGQESGVHISLGLPFIRTSVDHGTAKDIFGLDQANPQSMIESIRWCQRLVKLRNTRL